ncbi:hypothetical protein H2198_001610 [Neophaeococcomyces mojaviensis]|uniref:Uncharacterized protein n=1 Tax=Neophaeococcomyces mojaviensis TaxID=3383035 RepID=A0ACC3AGT0_9EURO|nr:hypothetical protein H2198_001610 [Knufia sp. JES_112]
MSSPLVFKCCDNQTCQQEKESLQMEVDLYKTYYMESWPGPPSFGKDLINEKAKVIHARREHIGCADEINSLRAQIAKLQGSVSLSSIASGQELLFEIGTLETSLEAVKAELEESKTGSQEKQAKIDKLAAECLVQKTKHAQRLESEFGQKFSIVDDDTVSDQGKLAAIRAILKQSSNQRTSKGNDSDPGAALAPHEEAADGPPTSTETVIDYPNAAGQLDRDTPMRHSSESVETAHPSQMQPQRQRRVPIPRTGQPIYKPPRTLQEARLRKYANY